MECTPIKIQVKTVSKERIKPSIPTLAHLKTFKLSYVDQIITPTHTCGLLFFDSASHPINIITSLKTSLSTTLTHFYPLSGRVNESTIFCNDEGIPFIETQVNCPLISFLKSPNKFELIPMLVPPRDSVGNIEDYDSGDGLIHLSFQINVFSCGGIVIGWYDIHKITDGTSATTFLKLWASIAAQNNGPSPIKPDLFAAVKAFPPLPEIKGLLPLSDATKDHVQNSPIIVKSFIFDNASITELKDKARSEQVPHPSRLQAIAGFLWERALHVSEPTSTNSEGGDTMLYITIDMRPWLDPPLPKEAIGNLSTMAMARSKKGATIRGLVEEVRTGFSKMKEEIRTYKGDRAVEILRENWNKRIETLSKYKGSVYKLVSWCNVGFKDINFGFGKPKWVVPTDGIMSPIHKNLFVLNDYEDPCDGSVGIEAWLFLEVQDMEILENDKEFLSYAKLYSP